MDNKLSELSKPVAWLAIYHGEVYDEAISITRSVVEAQAERFGWESALTEIIPLYRHAPPAPAVPDEIDSFADQVIGTKDKIIRLPAPIPVPHEGIRVYLNADAIISYVEKQGYIVEVSRE
ncbi:hypothetical protein SMGES_40160 [Serratia marcescens]|nr:hypothetical protein SMGES_40160 [Serratia marcescens]